ncbi:SdiA-regulated domain-containing protein [Nevskia sp.]|uniref:SdiA-regulated domain-containing protein n=1 Tax=Nevskia sp. TaxID=1929292 RepID=UPI0025F93B21|nr:SdiA-regulated domain-containing protein [Nevskia sp.]
MKGLAGRFGGSMVVAFMALGLAACDNGNDDAPAPTPTPPPAPTVLAAPTVAFTAPGESLDLANYTLIAQYDLPVGSGANLLAAEASGVAYNRDTGSLFVIADHGTSVVQVSRSGVLINSMTLPADASMPQGTFLYDPEGITWVGGSQFVVAEERYRQLARFSYTPDTTLAPGAIQQVKIGTTIGNIGLEGVAFDPQTGGYILVKENTPLGIFQTTVDFATGAASNGSPTTVDSVNLFNPALTGFSDLADVATLSSIYPSTAADYGDLLILGQENGAILKMTRSGVIRSRLDVGLPPQHEGIAIDENGVIYLVNELGGGSGRPQLWVYQPTTAASAVGTGSNVYLSFAEDISAGSGAFTISNGAGDNRTVALTDAEQVRISGRTVSIDLATNLVPGSTYTVTAPAGLVRSASGAASAALSTGFTARMETVPPMLTATAPADNAIAVNGSRVLLSFDEPVVAGTGSVILTGTRVGAADDVRTLAVGDITQVTISGNTVDINPSADLNPGTSYSVQIARGVINDLAGNPFAGLIGTTALNFTTAGQGGSLPPTVLNAGDLLFMGINGDQTDAIAFVLLRAVTAGTQVQFTDKDYVAASPTFPTNEAAFTWTSAEALPAGTIVTIQVGSLLTDIGVSTGVEGGISTTGETYYAFQGQIIDAGTGQITVDRFLAAINLGDAAGEIPAVISDANAFIRFDEDNARYAGSLDQTDLTAFATLVRNPANWERNDAAGYPLIEGSLFGTAAPPPAPGSMTELAAGEVLFTAINGDAPDAIAFVILRDIIAGTTISFTDKDYTVGAPTFPTNEAAFTWTATSAVPAGTIVTIATDPLTTDRGTVSGVAGGISTGAETYYAFQGTITNAATGEITVDRFLAAINLGLAAGDIPAEVTAANAFIRFDQDNARYNAALNRSDLAAFATLVRNPANWAVDDAAAYPLVNGRLFGGTVLAAGEVRFVAANADAPDAVAFTALRNLAPGTEILFFDKDYVAAAAFPINEAGFTWTATAPIPAGTLVTINVDALLTDFGTVVGEGGGISPNAETYYAAQGLIRNPGAGEVFVDRFLAAINLGGAAGEIPPELMPAGGFIRFDVDNVRYNGSRDVSDIAVFGARVADPANYELNDATAFPIVNGSLFPAP